MSYQAAAALQRALFQHLTAADVPTDLADVPVVDSLIAGALPETYVALGPERVRDASTKTTRGAEHRVIINVTSAKGGFQKVKQIAGAVCVQLDKTLPTLDVGTLCAFDFVRAQAARGQSGAARGIELIFRAVIDEI
ncbi:MAG: DUF3168 domain-containing protein [Pseudomonadota bacterium]